MAPHIPPSTLRQGTVPGFDYTIGHVPNLLCMFCLRQDISLMVEGLIPPQAPVMGLCEPCAALAAWAWGQVTGWNPPGPAFAQTPGAGLALIVKERKDDYLIPFDVLMVSRKDDPGAWGLPGGKIEGSEKPGEAAVRELKEETSLTSWPAAMESLYVGYSPRGRLVKVFLCRGWEGDPKPVEGLLVEWKSWPPSSHSGMFSGFYKGLEEAFGFRWQLQKLSTSVENRAPLSTHLSSVAADLVRLYSKRDGGTPWTPDEARRAGAYEWSLSTDERECAKHLKIIENKSRENKAIVSMPDAPSFLSSAAAAKVEVAVDGEGDGGGEGEEHEDDDNAAPDDEGEDESAKGFVR